MGPARAGRWGLVSPTRNLIFFVGRMDRPFQLLLSSPQVCKSIDQKNISTNNIIYEKHSGIEIFYQLVNVWIALLRIFVNAKCQYVVSSFDFRNTDATTSSFLFLIINPILQSKIHLYLILLTSSTINLQLILTDFMSLGTVSTSDAWVKKNVRKDYEKNNQRNEELELKAFSLQEMKNTA